MFCQLIKRDHFENDPQDEIEGCAPPLTGDYFMIFKISVGGTNQQFGVLQVPINPHKFA